MWNFNKETIDIALKDLDNLYIWSYISYKWTEYTITNINDTNYNMLLLDVTNNKTRYMYITYHDLVEDFANSYLDYKLIKSGE